MRARVFECATVRVQCSVHGVLASGMDIGGVVHKVPLSLEACCMDLSTLTQVLTQRYSMETK